GLHRARRDLRSLSHEAGEYENKDDRSSEAFAPFAEFAFFGDCLNLERRELIQGDVGSFEYGELVKRDVERLNGRVFHISAPISRDHPCEIARSNLSVV